MSQPVKPIEEQIRLLVIFHYVVAGITAIIGCFPMFHLAAGIFMLVVEPSGEVKIEDEQVLRLVGGVFTGVAALVIAGFWSLAILIFFGGRKLARRQSHTFCLVVAGFSCLMMPFGTALGVFTIIVLLKDEARELFGLPQLDSQS